MRSIFPGNFVPVLILEGKCLYWRARPAHLEGHLPRSGASLCSARFNVLELAGKLLAKYSGPSYEPHSRAVGRIVGFFTWTGAGTRQVLCSPALVSSDDGVPLCLRRQPSIRSGASSASGSPTHRTALQYSMRSRQRHSLRKIAPQSLKP